MAGSLQHLLDTDAPAQLAGMLQGAWPGFNRRAFVASVTPGYAALGLMARGQRIAEALRQHLPPAYPDAVAILVASMGPPVAVDAAGEPTREGQPSGSAFLYLPYSLYIAAHGLNHLALSLQAQHALTQRFTAEFCLRPFLEHHREATLAQLTVWTRDPSPHVRRLVSEGTRSRLPWAPRLRAFVDDPRPVLILLDRLKDDASSYVRRSVANHLGDIGKDHPDLLVDTARRWLVDATADRQRLVRHALRFVVKRGDAGALTALGMGHAVTLDVRDVSITPARPVIGGTVEIACTLHNPGSQPQQVLADLRVHYAKARGGSGAKVFKLKTLDIPPQGDVRLVKRLSLAQMTTRVHYPGAHPVELVLNGRAQALGQFTLRAIPSSS